MNKSIFLFLFFAILISVGCSKTEEIEPTNTLRSLLIYHESVNDLDLTGIEIIDGPVHIFNTDAIDLSFLGGIKQINGLIDIGNNEQLKSLNGLQNLESIQDINISQNTNLEDVSALQEIEIKNGIAFNTNGISSISKLNKLIDVNSVYIREPIASLDFLSNLESVNLLYLSNTDVSDLSELNNLKAAEHFNFRGNFLLEDYCQLKTIITNNDQITWSLIGNRSNPSREEVIATCN